MKINISKKFIIIMSLIVLLLASGISYWLYQRSTVSFAESASKTWSACLIREYGDPPEYWEGLLFYHGENELPKDSKFTAIADGEVMYEKKPFEASESYAYSLDQKLVFYKSHKTFESFMTHYDLKKPREVVVIVSWSEKGQEKEERLVLQ